MKSIKQVVSPNLPVILLITFCLGTDFIKYSPILGDWEQKTVFFTFAPEEIWMNTLIHPRGNVAGFEYAALDLSRHVANIFGFNIFSIRILPIIYGLIALFLMCRILNRWHSRKVAVIVTALLAANPVFLFFQHQLIVSIVTFCSLLFCIDRFDLVDSGTPTRKTAFMFGLSCAVVSLHYIVGRYCMLAIVLYCLTDEIVV